MTYKEIQELIRLFSKSNVGELSVEQDNFKIKLKSNESCQKVVTTTAAPVHAVAPPVQVAVAPSVDKTDAAPKVEVQSSAVEKTINAPMIGTFYRSNGPDKDPFVKVGDKVEVGQVICIIEAMKLFNEIESEVSGTIVKILINDATPIEYDQPLFIIE